MIKISGNGNLSSSYYKQFYITGRCKEERCSDFRHDFVGKIRFNSQAIAMLKMDVSSCLESCILMLKVSTNWASRKPFNLSKTSKKSKLENLLNCIYSQIFTNLNNT